MSKKLLWTGLLALALAGCKNGADKAKDEAADMPSAKKDQPAPGGGEESGEEPAKEKTEAAEVIEVEGDFQTPESVLFDDSAGVYLVSNIGGSPLEKDGNGFISRVKRDGTVDELKWIDGAAEGVTLNAPKGMAIWNGVLYVTDIDTVRKFDAESGEPAGEIEVEGATFMNDLAASDDAVYASDSGMKAGEEGFEPSGTDAIYEIGAGDELEKIAAGDELNGPNGVAPADDGVWVVTFRANELYRIDGEGEKKDVVTLPGGGLDGLVARDDGTVLVSSWEGKAVYHGAPKGPFEAVIEGVESPADIGYDGEKGRVLIPVFQGNAVQLHPLAAD